MNKFVVVVFSVSILFSCFRKIDKQENVSNIDLNKPISKIRYLADKKYNLYLHKTIKLEKNKITELSKSDSCFVELKENATTGFRWYFNNTNEKSLKAISEKKINFNKPDIVGGGVTHVWKFQAVEKGRAVLDFKYYRSWEGIENSVDSSRFEIRIK